MRILVTGGAGFIGSHIIDALLRQGDHVVCIDNFSLGKEEHLEHHSKNSHFSLRRLDLVTDRSAMELLFQREKFDCVFHLCANSDIQRGGKDPSLDLNRTFLSTFYVLECMRLYNVRDLVFSSSSAIYGDLSGKLNENSGPAFPKSLYGAGKLAAEGFISAYTENFDLRSWIFRFPNVVGPRATHGVLFDFILRLRQNPKQLTILGDGKQAKPYMHVHDLVQAILIGWKKSTGSFNCFNVGVDSFTTPDEIAEIVIEEMKLGSVVLSHTGGPRGWKGDVPRFEYDSSKMRKLGWKPSSTSTEAVRLAVKDLIEQSSVMQ